MVTWLRARQLSLCYFACLRIAQVGFTTHENLYLEVLTELGILGSALTLFGLGWLFWRIRWCVLHGRRSAPTLSPPR